MNFFTCKLRTFLPCTRKLKLGRSFSGAVFENETVKSNPYKKLRPRISLSKRRKESELTQYLKQPVSYTVTEWDSMKEKAVCNDEVTELGFVPYCMGICYLGKNFPTAKSLISYLISRGESPRLALVAMYLLICSTCYDDAGEDEFLRAYNDLKKLCENFEPYTLSYTIHGLSKTSRWKESLDMLTSMEKYGRPPTPPYCSIASAAFRNNEEDVGWEILERLQAENRIPSVDIIQEWLKLCERDGATITKFNRLITYCGEANLSMPVNCIELIKDFFERRKSHVGNYVAISPDGYCKHCNNYLEKLEISPEKFGELRDTLMKMILDSDDKFLAPNKDEFFRFTKFVHELSPFDVVVDGWSIADTYISAANWNRNEIITKSQILLQVLLQLTEKENKRVLVLSKKFMENWITDDLKGINSQKVGYFCTDNLTRDDPFLLCAAFANGPETLISSHDNFRDYELSLQSRRLRTLFRSWQWNHQLIKTVQKGRIQVTAPITYNPVAQKTGLSLHIPMSDNALPRLQSTNEVPKRWLCLKKLHDISE